MNEGFAIASRRYFGMRGIHLVPGPRCKDVACDLPAYEKSAGTNQCYYHWSLERRRDACLICFEIPQLSYRPRCCDCQFCNLCVVKWLKRESQEPACPHCRAPMEREYKLIMAYEEAQRAREQNKSTEQECMLRQESGKCAQRRWRTFKIQFLRRLKLKSIMRMKYKVSSSFCSKKYSRSMRVESYFSPRYALRISSLVSVSSSM